MPQMGFPSNEYSSPASSTNPYAAAPPTHHPHHSHHSSPVNSNVGLVVGLTHSISSGSGGNENHRKLEFYIPRETAGGIIGRGGQGLRDLMHETGCKIYIDKNETNEGGRLVRILSSTPNSNDEETNLQFAKEIIIKRVNEIKESHGEEIDG